LDTDFEQFLQAKKISIVGKKPLFEPLPSNPISEADVEQTEATLQCRLPNGFRTFLKTVGSGIWADAVFSLEEVYAFDEAVGEMCGFIALGINVNGCGDYVAFNPKEQTGTIYFCCHDPFGYAVAGASFESYIVALTQFTEQNRKSSEFYYKLEPFHEIEPPFLQAKRDANRPWWQFWK
jgi:hypothetical protein